MERMTSQKALAQRDHLRRLDRAYGQVRLLHGTELNIGPDGGLDWPDEFLTGFDLCIASVHSHFSQPRAEMTRRIIHACENPDVNIIGHPTTRLIGKRAPIDADWDAVFAACARTGTALEIDAYPDRLDLPADLIRLAWCPWPGLAGRHNFSNSPLCTTTRGQGDPACDTQQPHDRRTHSVRSLPGSDGCSRRPRLLGGRETKPDKRPLRTHGVTARPATAQVT